MRTSAPDGAEVPQLRPDLLSRRGLSLFLYGPSSVFVGAVVVKVADVTIARCFLALPKKGIDVWDTPRIGFFVNALLAFSCPVFTSPYG